MSYLHLPDEGSQVYAQAGAPAAITGVDGDFYINTSNGDYYLKDGSAWVLKGNLGGGGGGTPGGSDTEIQFNDGGAFDGVPALTWNKTTEILTASGFVKVPSLEGITLTAGPTITLTPSMNVLYCTSTTTVTFPEITAALNGKCFTVINGDASGSTTVTFTPHAGDTISGDFSGLTTRPYEGCKFMADNANSTWRPVVSLPSDLFVGNTVVGGVAKGLLYADNVGEAYLKCDATLTWDGTTLTVGEPDEHESQILFSTFTGQDGSFMGAGNGGPVTRISSPYYAFCLATNPGGDGLGTGVIGVNGINSLIEWEQTGELYFNGLQWPAADGTDGQVLLTDGLGVLSWGDAPVGIGAVVAGGTPGSILYIDASGDLAEDNANFNYDASTPVLNATSIDATVTLIAGGGPTTATMIATTTGTNFYDGMNAVVGSIDLAGAMTASSLTLTGAIDCGDVVADGMSVTASEADFDASVYAKDFIISSNGTSGGTLGHALTTTTLGFFGAAAVAQQAAIVDATGGVVEDAEARAAVNAILAALRLYGLIVT
jgi:hypothetical protein